MVINNVISASQQVSMNYLTKDKVWSVTKVGTYVIDVTELEIGGNGIMDGILALRDVYKQKVITARIAGHDYQNADFVSLNFNESSLSDSTVATIVIEQSTPVENLGPLDLLRPEDIESFSENFDFQRSGDNYTRTRKLNVKYKKNVHSEELLFINEVKAQLNAYFERTAPKYGCEQDEISQTARTDDGRNGNITEQVDLINLSFSFSEVFECGYIKISPLPDVSIKKSYVLSLDDLGFETKQYSIELKSYETNLTIIQEKIKEVINELITEEGISPQSVSKGYDVNGKSASIGINFSTNPNNAGGNVTSFSVEKTEEGGVDTYSLKLDYTTDVGDSKTDKFNNAISMWTTAIHGNDDSYVTRLFAEATAIYEVSRDTSFIKSSATISDDILFSTDSGYEANQGIVSYKLSSSIGNFATNEFRHEKIVDINQTGDLGKELISTNKKKKITNLSSRLAVKFTEEKRSSILSYMRNNGRFDDLEKEAKNLTTLQNLNITSDTISIDLDAYSASRSISFNSYE